ncbi:hypothetical protein AB0M02_30730 [Actinoplanes sp. NPDC051861]|uniref:hypothetical protein n=1 Tax=Actinoplanes sp. NPDC051861 TaxID=3155170 RepID=UPI00342F94F5
MSPRTRLPLAVGALLLTAACGTPPDAPPSAFPPVSAPAPAPSADLTTGITTVPPATLPTNPVTTYTVPGYATPPPLSTTTATTAPLTKSPTPTPTHAARCTGEPTAAQILKLVEDDPGVPDQGLQVADGPYCAGTWSFTSVRIAGDSQAEQLQVSATGKGAQLKLVAAGTDVCNPRMQTEAPAGIRVLACGF